MKYIYGPVKSRRLNMSLGITLTPYKICNFDCIYCQLGKTGELTCERKEYIKIEDVVAELKSWLQNNAEEAKNLNYITISGSGEPTLNIKIGELIKEIKGITAIAVAVITNASLLNAIEVRGALLNADLLVPSLDTVVPKVFNKINRPHQNIKIDHIINGLINLRKEFRGKIWLEVMLVRQVNDDLRYIKKLKEVIEAINPDKIQLNSPVRTSQRAVVWLPISQRAMVWPPLAKAIAKATTAEVGVFSVSRKKLEKIKEILGEKAEII